MGFCSEKYLHRFDQKFAVLNRNGVIIVTAIGRKKSYPKIAIRVHLSGNFGRRCSMPMPVRNPR